MYQQNLRQWPVTSLPRAASTSHWRATRVPSPAEIARRQGDHQTNKQDFGECLSAYLSLGILFVCLRNGNDLFVCLYRLPRNCSVLAFE